MALDAPSDDQIAAVHAKIGTALANDREPFADFDLGDYQLIGRLWATSVERYSMFRAAVQRQLADAGWPATRIRQVRFRVFEQSGANQKRDHEEEERKVGDLIELKVHEGTQRNRQHASAHAAANVMSAQELITSGSPRLITMGVLAMYRAGRIWHDSFHLNHFTDWNGTVDDRPIPVQPLTEEIENEIIAWLHGIDYRLSKASDRTLLAAISTFALRDKRNEPQQWLRSLVWDGKPDWNDLFPIGFGAGDMEFTREAGRCWMVSMVARVMNPGCKVDTLPVFAGGEGIRKGQALETIGGKYYRAATSKMGEKDFLQQLIGAIVFELPEMHSFSGRSRSTDENKFIITNANDYFRAPYERKPSEHARTAVMAATTNTLRWYGDLGPGRRFDPLFCSAINLDWLRAKRDNLWAGAYHCLQLGTDHPLGCWWNQPVEEHAARIDTAREEIEFVEQIRAWLEVVLHYDGANDTKPTASRWQPDSEGTGGRTIYGTLLETDRIAREALALNQETMARNNNRQKIGRAMRALGFEDDQQRIRGTNQRRRFWTRHTGQEIEIELVETPVTDRDIPEGKFPF